MGSHAPAVSLSVFFDERIRVHRISQRPAMISAMIANRKDSLATAKPTENQRICLSCFVLPYKKSLIHIFIILHIFRKFTERCTDRITFNVFYYLRNFAERNRRTLRSIERKEILKVFWHKINTPV